MSLDSRTRSRVTWLAAGAIAGVASVVACGGPDTVDAGATDAGISPGCCDCTCTVPDPLTLQGTVDTVVTNAAPIDVSVSSPISVAGTVDVNIASPVPLSVEVSNAMPLDVTLTNAVPLNVAVATPIVVGPPLQPTFLGITSTLYDGDDGYATMNAACNAEFPGSRMCSTTVLLDLYPAPIPVADAWLWSRIVGAGASHGLNELGAAGAGNTGSMNCSVGPSYPAFGNLTGSWDGTILTATGDIQPAQCFMARAVACCGYMP